MSATIEMAIVNTRRFYVSNQIQPLTTAALLAAYAEGATVHLYSVAERGWLYGHIQGVRNESGSPAGKAPKLLLVTLTTQDERCVELFVRTAG